MKSDKELYRQLRDLSCEKLLEEMARFDRADARERMQRVAVIRAVGVAFAGAGTAAQKAFVRAWLMGLLKDPAEKVRRYAMAAMPKIGAGAKAEGELLSILQKTTLEREKKSVGRALDKIGGAATLDAAAAGAGVLPQTEQKVKASLARTDQPSVIRMDHPVSPSTRLLIRLRCRRGLEDILRGEVDEYITKHKTFRLIDIRNEYVSVSPLKPFRLGDLYTLRCFASVGFVLGNVRGLTPEASIDAMAALITSPLSRQLLEAFTEGSIRYRLDFIAKGHQRGAVRLLANRTYELCPEILNDPHHAPWSIDIHPTYDGGVSIELRPKLTPDPRWFYRLDDVPAASHPPLAACMARLAGPATGEIVWDPFCGSGLELIETALRGGVQRIFGTDLSPEAIAVAQANVAAAKLVGVEAGFACRDFRDFASIDGLGPESVSLIITNPPMGRRIRLPDIHGLFNDLFKAAAVVLKPDGRLVFVNPLRPEVRPKPWVAKSRQVVDLGGFDCRLEVYVKQK